MLIAGEASGDRIAARAVRAAKVLAQQRGEAVEVFGIAGDECAAEGVRCLHTSAEMSVVGLVEVLRRFTFFRRVLAEMTKQLDDARPDVLLLVDYPGFNLRLAREAARRGIRVVYYVSPQVWAWHASRVREIREVVSTMCVILPFEQQIYRDAGLEQSFFVGHPLVERIEEERASWRGKEAFAARYGLDATKDWLLVFAGSRREEVRRLLPTMTQAGRDFAQRHGMQAILVESEAIPAETFSPYRSQELRAVRDASAVHELMAHARIGLLKSGTTTLEAALIGLPGVICYKTHPLTFAIGKRVVKIAYIGLANIALGRKLYPELLQGDVTPQKMCAELEQVLAGEQAFKASLDGLAGTLRTNGPGPSRQVASFLLAS